MDVRVGAILHVGVEDVLEYALGELEGCAADGADDYVAVRSAPGLDGRADLVVCRFDVHELIIPNLRPAV